MSLCSWSTSIDSALPRMCLGWSPVSLRAGSTSIPVQTSPSMSQPSYVGPTCTSSFNYCEYYNEFVRVGMDTVCFNLCVILRNLYLAGCHRQHGFAFPRLLHPHTHVRHRGPHQLPSCLHGKRNQCTAHCVRHQQRLVGGLRSEDHVGLHLPNESSIVGARLHTCFSGTALRSS